MASEGRGQSQRIGLGDKDAYLHDHSEHGVGDAHVADRRDTRAVQDRDHFCEREKRQVRPHSGSHTATFATLAVVKKMSY